MTLIFQYVGHCDLLSGIRHVADCNGDRNSLCQQYESYIHVLISLCGIRSRLAQAYFYFASEISIFVIVLTILRVSRVNSAFSFSVASWIRRVETRTRRDLDKLGREQGGGSVKEAGGVLIKGRRARKVLARFLTARHDRNSVLVTLLGVIRRRCGPPRHMHASHSRDTHNDGGASGTYIGVCASRTRFWYICTYVAAYLLDALLSLVLPGRIPLGPITFDLSAGCRR